MSEIREMVGNMPFLIPGVGVQGGDIESMVKSGQTSDGMGMIIHSSRGILYASKESNFADAARDVILKLHNQINIYRNKM